MSMKEWIDLDIDKLELLEVTDIEKAQVKQNVLNKRKKSPIWRHIAVAAVMIVGATTATGFAFPSFASQIPFMDNVISYFNNEEQHYKNFETFSTNIDLAQTSNGVTVMIDNAVYDGTNVTVSFAIETNHEFGKEMHMSAPNWFDAVGASGSSGGGSQITKISDTRYVGLSTFTPRFKDDVSPETVEVTWTPHAFYSMSNDLEVEGDWSFAFSLKRLEGDIQLVNETVLHKDMSFTLQSVEFTDVSTVILYEQVVTDELLKEWPSVSPVFYVTDDLGHVYLNGSGGSGMSPDNGKTFNGTAALGAIQEGASQLIIQPVEIASLMSGKGHIEIELDPIIVDLKK
ncbi:DUF4179 domain-containing protein [Paenisporosarcina sp. FSL H8-0542]|uniref:DUF4179 domain-containing protein n=1 Tax=Paenisporosarcina sp. FSL H8-0542 TaxID=2921401 RepID=UPI00315B277D